MGSWREVESNGRKDWNCGKLRPMEGRMGSWREVETVRRKNETNGRNDGIMEEC